VQYTLVETKTEKDHLVEQIRVRHLFKEFVPIAMDEGIEINAKNAKDWAN
jgi:hypothetical protein